MNKYELLYIIDNSASDEQKNALVEKFKAFVESKNGTVESIDKWGTRKFAYPINFKNEGYYVLMNFTAPSTVVKEMNSVMLVTEHMVRQMFVRK
ncbi:MAG: 30S ribosomal protein S6 [Clostridia bacterium]|nr:30S ribosomal protein S6 [Clostridia bacterium]